MNQSDLQGILDLVAVFEKSKVSTESILDSMPLLLIIVDSAGNLYRINHESEGHLRVPMEDIAGRHISEFFTPEQTSGILATIKQCEGGTDTKIQIDVELGTAASKNVRNILFEIKKFKVETVIGQLFLMTGLDVTQYRASISRKTALELELNMEKAKSCRLSILASFNDILLGDGFSEGFEKVIKACLKNFTISEAIYYSFNPGNDCLTAMTSIHSVISNLGPEDQHPHLAGDISRNFLISDPNNRVADTFRKKVSKWLTFPQLNSIRTSILLYVSFESTSHGVLEIRSDELIERDPQFFDTLIEVAAKLGSFIHQLELEGRIAEKNRQLTLEQQQREMMQTQLIQASKLASLGTLGAGVAHELNNPLAAVRGFADLIARDPKSTEQNRTWGNKIIKASVRMEKIISHLRQFASDTSNSEWIDLDVNDPIRDSLILLQGSLDQQNIAVRLSLSENLPVVHGDYNQLESVFQNLLSNSQDAFEDAAGGSGKRFVTFRTFADGSNVGIEYEDNAGGISDKIIDRVFEPFFTTKEVGKGTGLGLSIAHSIIKDHGGTIGVRTRDRQGTIFHITLPASTKTISRSAAMPGQGDMFRNNEVQSDLPLTTDIQEIPRHPRDKVAVQMGELNQPIASVSKRLPKVLIIDDEDLILDMMAAYLGDCFDITTTIDPFDGLSKALSGTFDLIITDIKMPKMNGFELMAKIREVDEQIPIVVMTGHAQSPEQVQESLRLGAKEVIPKPLPTKADLVSILRKAILDSE